MTPEERANRAYDKMRGEVMSLHVSDITLHQARVAILAAAIRSAENAAYERAANTLGPWITRLSRAEAKEAAAAIQALYRAGE